MMSRSEEIGDVEHSPQTHGNIANSVEDFSEELEYFDFSRLPGVQPDSLNCAAKPVALLLASLVEVGWELLQRYRVASSKHEDAEANHRTLSDDNRHLQAKVQQLKTELSKKDKTFDHASDKTETLKRRNEKLQKELKAVKEEVTCLKSKLAHQACQHAHTVRRKDAEIENLQNQFQRRVALNLPWKPRSPPLLSVEQEALYKDVICKFESNNLLLLQENIVLRDAFYKLHTDLGLITWEYKDLVDKHCKESNNEEQYKLDLPEVLSKSFYKLPYEVASKEIDTSTRKYFDALHSIIEIFDDKLEGIT